MANDLNPATAAPANSQTTSWTGVETRAQFAAVTRLRWRITVNQFRGKGGGGELVGRIIMGIIFAGFAIGMMFLAGVMSALAVGTGHLNRIDLVLWAAFGLTQFLNIQVGQPGTVFDPTQLIRFPMESRTYILIRLFFGFLTPSNIIIALVSLSIAVGITIADTSLWLYAFIGLAIFALTNALFTRMIFAWVDRWLSTRRAREVFTACIFLFTLGIQWLNVTFNPAYNHHQHARLPAQRITAVIGVFHRAQPFIGPLPPGLISSSLLAARAGNKLAFLVYTLACLAFAALFFAIFAWRTRTEFRGENLTDAANAVSKTSSPKPAGPLVSPAAALVAVPATGAALPSTIAAVLGKELLQIRRNAGLFMGLIAPVFFVFLFAGRIATRTSAPWLFPLALVYVMMGIAPLSYNSFGLEGAGTQFYFMAPIRFRDVFLAKNLMNFALAAIDIVITLVVIGYIAILPGKSILISALLWSAATLLFTTTLGNRRSITTPKKIELGRVASKQASQTSALIAFGVLLGSAAVGASFLLLALYFGRQWFLVPLFAALAAAAFFTYRQSLNTLDAFTLAHRESMLEVLCKP